MKTLTLTAENHVIDALVNFLSIFKGNEIKVLQEKNEPTLLKPFKAQGIFATGNEEIDYDAMEQDLLELSRQTELHILEKWDREN